jgi:predicted ester cyclase
VKRAVEALNGGDFATYAAAFWPDAQRVVPGVSGPIDMTASLQMLRYLASAFDGWHLEADLLLESGDHVVAQWRATGVHTGEFAGIAPTNRHVEVVNCEIYEFRDGKVARSWAYGDPAEMVVQLTAEEGPR